MGGPVRVLHVVVNMNRGGAETLIMNLYRNMDRSKIQFDFLTCKEGIFDKEIKDLGGRVHRIPYITETGHFGFLRELKIFFRNSSYKIVHSHLDKMSGLVLRTARQAGIPIRISHSHNTSSEGGLVAKMYKWYAGSFILSNSTHLISCSNNAARWLFNRRYDSSLILKNGIEIDKFLFSPPIRKKVREELKVVDSTLVMGHIGRFNHQKNHLFLLEVFSEVNKLLKDSVLVLVGDGELRSKIEKKIIELDLVGKVVLLGIRSDINELLQAFDLFLFPSLHEGLPVSLIEAQGAGLPCIISSHISEEVDLGLNLITYTPITSIHKWVDIISNFNRLMINRNHMLNPIEEQGFNIKKTANYMEDYYFSLSR